MKIGIVTEYYYPYLGGIAEHVHNTYLYLKGCDIEVKIIAPEVAFRGEAHLFETRAPERDIIRVGKSYPFYGNGGFVRFTSPLGLKKTLKAIFHRERFDLIHVHSPLVPTLPMIAVRAADCPIVGTFHTIFQRSMGYRMFGRFCRSLMEKIDVKIAVSPLGARLIRRYFHGDFTVIPNGVDVTMFQPGIPPISDFRQDDTKNILFLGRFDPHNGVNVMLKAFTRVKAEYPKCRLIIVGDGPLKNKYVKLASPLAPAVHFAGAQHRSRPNYFQTADIFCHPASLHNLSIVGLEAMASGVPIVASDIETFRWCLKEAAIYFPKGNADGLADALLHLLRRPELRKELGEHARRQALSFSWDLIGRRILDHYRHLVGLSPNPTGHEGWNARCERPPADALHHPSKAKGGLA